MRLDAWATKEQQKETLKLASRGKRAKSLKGGQLAFGRVLELVSLAAVWCDTGVLRWAYMGERGCYGDKVNTADDHYTTTAPQQVVQSLAFESTLPDLSIASSSTKSTPEEEQLHIASHPLQELSPRIKLPTKPPLSPVQGIYKPFYKLQSRPRLSTTTTSL